MSRIHHGLLAWQHAMKFVKDIYEVTSAFPKCEMYGLTSQMRRAAVSVPSNIAEGAGRASFREFGQFLTIARGSLCELETQVVLAKELGYIAENDDLLSKMEKLFALLGGLINSIGKRYQQ
ncbi:MAG: four helix bundle protein [Gammaproteobacteria bacterium]|nr:four helix bundle protein [Gammaproteobacteria bacterium]